MNLHVECWVCGKRFPVERPFALTYDCVIDHVESKHPASAVTFAKAMQIIDAQLPDEFHRAIMEGNNKGENLT